MAKKSTPKPDDSSEQTPTPDNTAGAPAAGASPAPAEGASPTPPAPTDAAQASAPETPAAAVPTAETPADATASAASPAAEASASAEPLAEAAAEPAPEPTAAEPSPAEPSPADVKAESNRPAPDDVPLSAEAIDDLLKQAGVMESVDAATSAQASKSADAGENQPSIDELLQQANFDDGSALASEHNAPSTESFSLPAFQQALGDAQASSIDLLRDVELNVKIELGRSRMLVEDVLKLSEGSVVELDKLAGDPVDVFVNERLVARGEVLVLNDNFCVRVNEIVAGLKDDGL